MHSCSVTQQQSCAPQILMTSTDLSFSAQLKRYGHFKPTGFHTYFRTLNRRRLSQVWWTMDNTNTIL